MLFRIRVSIISLPSFVLTILSSTHSGRSQRVCLSTALGPWLQTHSQGSVESILWHHFGAGWRFEWSWGPWNRVGQWYPTE